MVRVLHKKGDCYRSYNGDTMFSSILVWELYGEYPESIEVEIREDDGYIKVLNFMVVLHDIGYIARLPLYYRGKKVRIIIREEGKE